MSFLSSLSRRDLRVLRESVRKVHLHYFPEDAIPVEQVDMMIETFGEEACESILRQALDNGMVEKKIIVPVSKKIPRVSEIMRPNLNRDKKSLVEPVKKAVIIDGKKGL